MKYLSYLLIIVAMLSIETSVARAQTPTRPPQINPDLQPGSPAPAQSASQPPETETKDLPSDELTLEKIEQLRKTAVDATNLDDTIRNQIAEHYRLAAEQVTRAYALAEQRASLQAKIDSAEATSVALQASLISQPESLPPPPDDNQPLPQLEQQLTQSEQRLKTLREESLRAENALNSRSDRRKAIRQGLAQASDALEAIPRKIDNATLSTDPMLAAAQRTEAKSQEMMLKAEIATLGPQLKLLDAEDARDLPRLEREKLARDVKAAEAALEQLQGYVQSRRASSATEQASDARRVADQKSHPLLQAMAERNVELAEMYQQVVQRMRTEEGLLNEASQIRDAWRKQSENARNKVTSIGLTDAIGAMLRKQKLSLPNTRLINTEIRNRTETISEAQFRLLELEDERSADLPRTLRMHYDLESLGLGSNYVPTGELAEQANEIIQQRNSLLGTLILSQNGYFTTLVELSTVQQQLWNQVVDYRDFIDERILWVRSSKPLNSVLLNRSADVGSITSYRWTEIGKSIKRDLLNHPLLYLFAISTSVLLIVLRPFLGKLIDRLSTQAEKRSCISYLPTIRCFYASVFAAIPVPLIIGFVGWRLYWAEAGDDFQRAFGSGILIVAAVWIPTAIVHSMLRKSGLAESHFGWQSSVVAPLRKSVQTLMLIGLPIATFATVLGNLDGVATTNALARVAFIILMLIIAFYGYRIFNSKSGALSEFLKKDPDSWLNRLWPLVALTVVLIPLLLAALSFCGYHFTARTLFQKFRVSFGTCVAFGITSAMLSRLLLVQRRKVTVEQARNKHLASLSESVGAADVTWSQIEFLSREELHSQISQSRRLVRYLLAGITVVFLWFVWTDILPAIGFLEQWPLWQSSTQVTEMTQLGNEAPVWTSRDVVDNVTIADLLLAILIGITTFVATRNLPGALEFLVLKKLPIESSVRYAITSIASYLIALAGIVVAFGIIGIHWKQVQWLATALTFGLAFGLQEMFANFIAGIIILFERPIRVGDIVTVDNVTGTVSKVRMRATTITNFDRKDYIVPNKDFITGRVLNWTLSDQVNRIVIKLGVAYGSDTEKVVRALETIALEHPQVMKDPSPQVTFDAFGDSTLDFSLRCFISMEQMPHRLSIVHELNIAVDECCRREEIEIAFPQHDIHIRSQVAKS